MKVIPPKWYVRFTISAENITGRPQDTITHTALFRIATGEAARTHVLNNAPSPCKIEEVRLATPDDRASQRDI